MQTLTDDIADEHELVSLALMELNAKIEGRTVTGAAESADPDYDTADIPLKVEGCMTKHRKQQLTEILLVALRVCVVTICSR